MATVTALKTALGYTDVPRYTPDFPEQPRPFSRVLLRSRGTRADMLAAMAPEARARREEVLAAFPEVMDEQDVIAWEVTHPKRGSRFFDRMDYETWLAYEVAKMPGDYEVVGRAGFWA